MRAPPWQRRVRPASQMVSFQSFDHVAGLRRHCSNSIHLHFLHHRGERTVHQSRINATTDARPRARLEKLERPDPTSALTISRPHESPE